MPMSVTSQVLYDGPRNVVMQFTGISDGSVESNVPKVVMSDLNPKPLSVKVTEVQYDVGGGIVQLSWDAVEPVPFMTLADVGEYDYRLMGGMVNGGGDTATGNILLSTPGFDAGSTYTFTIKMLKKFA